MRMKPIEEATLADRFIFFKVMQDADLCRHLLEIILNVEIERIEYLEGEKNIEAKYDSKGIRLDVYVKDGMNTVYNIEMQAPYALHLPPRSRYYQGMMDVDILEKGAGYEALSKSFVIFICMSDVFGKGRHIYTFENRCIEDTTLALGDGTRKIFLNPYSNMDDVTPELAGFLKYLADGVATDEFTERLVEAVETAKKNPRIMVEYMSYYADQADREAEREAARRDGLAEGIEKGIERGKAEGIINTIKSINGTIETAIQQLITQCGMDAEKAARTAEMYWNEKQ